MLYSIHTKDILHRGGIALQVLRFINFKWFVGYTYQNKSLIAISLCCLRFPALSYTFSWSVLSPSLPLFAVGLLDRVKVFEALLPSHIVGVLFLGDLAELVHLEDGVGDEAVPGDEDDVGVCPAALSARALFFFFLSLFFLRRNEGGQNSQLPADEELLALEQPVEDGDDAQNLLLVALNGRGHLLRVELVEPDGLAEVRALAGHLEVDELLDVPVLVGGGALEEALLVVGLDDVLDDGARLPERQVGVGVDDGGEAAVGVDLDELCALGILDDDLGVLSAGCSNVALQRWRFFLPFRRGCRAPRG